MLGDTYHNLETGTYFSPCLCIPPITGLTTPSNTFPDQSAVGICIPLHLTTLTGPDSEQVNQITTLPIITSDGLSYGGQLAVHNSRVLPKLQLEGFMDTPCIQQGEYLISQLIDNSGIRYMYSEVLAMMIEGRANVKSDGTWGRLDPLWFRDGYGRVYLEPRIIAFTANYLEGTPQRTPFTMTLKI